MKDYFCYDGNDVPFYIGEFQALNPKEAEKFNQKFVDELNLRLLHFRNICASDMNISIEKLDYSHESLLIVWDWFTQNATLQRASSELIEERKARAKIFGDSCLYFEEYSLDSKRRIFDIGAYWGACFTKLIPDSYWSYLKKPKSEITCNQPAVYGIKTYYKGNQIKDSFAPIHKASVQAAEIFSTNSGRLYKDSLYKMHSVWLDMIFNPNH